MSFEAWYLHKVEQCERMAADARYAAERTKFKEKARLWRDLAKRCDDGPPGRHFMKQGSG